MHFVATLCLSALALFGNASPVPSDGRSDQLLLGDAVPVGFNIDLHEMRLIEFGPDEAPVWMTESEKISAKAAGKKFFDVTDTPGLTNAAGHLDRTKPYPSPNASDLVIPVIKTLAVEGMIENLQKFTSFRTRYYRSETGKQSQQWLVGRIGEITTEYATSALQSLITVTEFTHAWGQNSIILRIKGASEEATATNGTVIIGAHQDSANFLPFLPAPGADDDGSGSVTILEAYRGLLAANFTPLHDVEFHWYSAEEGGLLGSQAVAAAYAAEKANVRSMVQFDMTAWVKAGTREEVGIITDFVDAELTQFIRELVDTYLDIPYVETECGYACSDHASWAKAGYPSAFSIESTFDNSNKNIHGANDRLDISPEFSFTHMLEFSKLAAAYVIELAGWAK